MNKKTEGLAPDKQEKTEALGALPDQKTSNVDPRENTSSLINPLQRKVSIGRMGTVSQAAPHELEKLRPQND